MALVMGTASVPGNSTVAVFTVPPGYCNVMFYQPSQAQSVVVGTSMRLTPTNGMLLATTGTPSNTEAYVGSGGATWYATTGNGTAATFCYLISSTN